ncbi:MAG TPA: TlpA disulfide reductase family protein [Halanaerobiales bacterium]|nr:TlpA disulfide reductase family protein [Halanaerobiales bacterium]
MQKKSLLLVLLILLVLYTGLSYYLKIWPFTNNNIEEVPVGTEIGERAPDFSLDLINRKQLTLSELRGKIVFLNFWATWCPPCQAEMPDIQKLHNEHENISILGINVQENKATVSEYMMSNRYSFPVVLDNKGEVSRKYLVRGIPTTYILDENGVIIARHIGPLSYEQMLDLIN